jgi:hypothetical protein
MNEMKTYSGGCHCGAVRYEVEVSLERVIACNCSLCTKRGLLLAFTPAQGFRLGSGDEKLRDYRFNKKVIRHQFCEDCGVEAFARGQAPDGAEMIAVNVRCLDGLDLGTISPTPFNGRDQ